MPESIGSSSQNQPDLIQYGTAMDASVQVYGQAIQDQLEKGGGKLTADQAKTLLQQQQALLASNPQLPAGDQALLEQWQQTVISAGGLEQGPQDASTPTSTSEAQADLQSTNPSVVAEGVSYLLGLPSNSNDSNVTALANAIVLANATGGFGNVNSTSAPAIEGELSQYVEEGSLQSNPTLSNYLTTLSTQLAGSNISNASPQALQASYSSADQATLLSLLTAQFPDASPTVLYNLSSTLSSLNSTDPTKITAALAAIAKALGISLSSDALIALGGAVAHSNLTDPGAFVSSLLQGSGSAGQCLTEYLSMGGIDLDKPSKGNDLDSANDINSFLNGMTGLVSADIGSSPTTSIAIPGQTPPLNALSGSMNSANAGLASASATTAQLSSTLNILKNPPLIDPSAPPGSNPYMAPSFFAIMYRVLAEWYKVSGDIIMQSSKLDQALIQVGLSMAESAFNAAVGSAQAQAQATLADANSLTSQANQAMATGGASIGVAVGGFLMQLGMQHSARSDSDEQTDSINENYDDSEEDDPVRAQAEQNAINEESTTGGAALKDNPEFGSDDPAASTDLADTYADAGTTRNVRNNLKDDQKALEKQRNSETDTTKRAQISNKIRLIKQRREDLKAQIQAHDAGVNQNQLREIRETSDIRQFSRTRDITGQIHAAETEKSETYVGGTKTGYKKAIANKARIVTKYTQTSETKTARALEDYKISALKAQRDRVRTNADEAVRTGKVTTPEESPPYTKAQLDKAHERLAQRNRELKEVKGDYMRKVQAGGAIQQQVQTWEQLANQIAKSGIDYHYLTQQAGIKTQQAGWQMSAGIEQGFAQFFNQMGNTLGQTMQKATEEWKEAMQTFQSIVQMLQQLAEATRQH